MIAHNPLDAEGWITELEKVYGILKSTEAEKVDCALHLLQGPAATWWDVEVQKKVDGKHTWEQFKQLFLDHHFPESKRDEYMEEFMLLRQAERTVAEYEREFARLARFAPQLTTKDADRASRFLKGLNLEIFTIVKGINPGSYADTLACAMRIEVGKVLKKQRNEKKRNKNDQLGGFNKKPFVKNNNSASG